MFQVSGFRFSVFKMAWFTLYMIYCFPFQKTGCALYTCKSGIYFESVILYMYNINFKSELTMATVIAIER